MTKGRLVPDPTWGAQAAREFNGQGDEDQRTQKILCYRCAKEGNFSTPDYIAFHQGTSLCKDHMI